MDQFYTKPDIALKYYEILKSIVDIDEYDILLEPAAGKGAFFNLLPEERRQGLDIEPKSENIERMDYFDFIPEENLKYLVIGNPPFGKISSIAIKFFNKSAEFADIIAFIIPRTFKRVSVQNKLNLNFHLIYTEDLPLIPCCFEPKMGAKCCFQIWRKKNELRDKIVFELSHPDFEFLPLGDKDDNNQPTPPNGADFVVKAYGSNCGEIRDYDLFELRPKSWHWIKSNIEVNILKNNIRHLDFSIARDTVRQDSIGHGEFIWLYKQKYY